MAGLGSIFSRFDPEILRSLRWQYFLNIGVGFLGALYILGLGRLLGPELFGVYTLCAAFPAVVVVLLDFRLQEFILYLKENTEKSEFSYIFSSIAWFDLIIKLSVFILSLIVFFVFHWAGYRGIIFEYVLLGSILVFISKCLSGPAMGVLRASGQLEYFSIAQVADWFLRLTALGALFLVDRVDISLVFWTQIVVGGLLNAIVVRRAMTVIEMTPAQIFSGSRRLGALVKKYRSLLFANQGISGTEAVIKELDVLICGIYLSTSQIATYKIAKSMAAIAWRLADPIFIVILPKLAQLYAIGRDAELSAFIRGLILGLAPAAILLFGAGVAGVWLFGPLALGPEYADAIALYPLASAWILLSLPLAWTHSLAVASGKPVIQLVGSGFGNGIGMAAIWLGAWRFGSEGALVGLSLAYCLPFVFSCLLLRRMGIFRWR